MKIVSVVPTRNLSGGGEKSFFEVLKFTQENGHMNHVIIPSDSEDDYIEQLEANGITYELGEFKSFGLLGDHSLQELDQILAITKLLLANKPDIVMTNLHIEPSQWAAALCNVPHVYFDRGYLGLLSNHGSLPVDAPSFVNYANAILCNSMNAKNILSENFGVDSQLVYSYVQMPTTVIGDSNLARIIIPANFFPEKNHLDILAAVAKVKTIIRDFNTEVLFVGSIVDESNCKHYEKIIHTIEELGLSNTVKFVEYQKNPWSLFSSKDIYVNAGEGEAVGRATIEAEMLGLTTIISDIPGHWEHKHVFGNLNTFELHNIDELANRILYVLDSKNSTAITRHNLSVKKKAIQWMTRENTMGEILGVLDRIKGQDNPAKLTVYDDITSMIYHFKVDYARMQKFEQLATVYQKETDIEIKRLREPGVKLALRKLAGSLKRKLLT